MSDETKIDLSSGDESPQADPDGLTFISPEEAVVPPEVEAARRKEPYPVNCAYDAYLYLEGFIEGFALIPKGSKYLPHLAKIAQAALNDKSDILDELSRAHARGRCRSQGEIDIDDASEAEAAEVK